MDHLMPPRKKYCAKKTWPEAAGGELTYIRERIEYAMTMFMLDDPSRPLEKAPLHHFPLISEIIRLSEDEEAYYAKVKNSESNQEMASIPIPDVFQSCTETDVTRRNPKYAMLNPSRKIGNITVAECIESIFLFDKWLFKYRYSYEDVTRNQLSLGYMPIHAGGSKKIFKRKSRSVVRCGPEKAEILHEERKYKFPPELIKRLNRIYERHRDLFIGIASDNESTESDYSSEDTSEDCEDSTEDDDSEDLPHKIASARS
ncbi:unnamed protein product [Caenorhabditis bovis]|uniref:Uncharacterized protein n=1 Tax=Caenorhabditis bovis TaxID=2654633 RepID=A0A8S1EP88_9PELO|nr:unnamed protein product [Caenorhabditis bovis]